METNEISSRLDSALQKAKGGIIIDEYVKSLYLTKAQAKFVGMMLSQYEYGDVLRHSLGTMLTDKEDITFDVEGDEYTVDAEDNVKAIVYEEINDTKVTTIPLDYNDIHDARLNPFRKPYKKLAYRITGNKKLTIFSSEIVTRYFYVYCKNPGPIVLEAMPTETPIDGVIVETKSELPYDSMLEVIDLTVIEIIKDISILSSPKKAAEEEKQ